MALSSGAPSIRFEGDVKRATALIPEGQLLLATAHGIAQRAGVPTFSMQQQIDEESYIYLLVANGLNIIQISVAPQVPDEPNPEPEVPEIPATVSLLSGVVFDGHIVDVPKPAAPGKPQSFKAVKSWQPT